MAETSSEAFKSGFVALVGRPSVGKSTLVNACVGEKVSITSPVAQTTRRRLRAVVNTENAQIIIVDTPGLHKPKDALGKELNKAALGELADVDVAAFLIDATRPVGRGDEWVAKHVEASPAPFKLLVITKADIATPEQVSSQLEAARALMRFDDELVVSAAQGFTWAKDGHGSILATIMVERPGQKAIVIGKGGQMIKKIGIEARKDIEYLFGTNIYLDLEVRVQPEWRRDQNEIRRLGYDAGE